MNRSSYENGQKFFLNAIRLNKNDSDAYASLAGTYKRSEMHKKAHKWYKKALEINPNDPYPLINFLIYEIRNSKDTTPIINYNHRLIKKAIRKRSNQISVLVDIPWAFFDVGTLSLLLGNIDVSLHNYIMAIKLSQHNWMINTTLETLNKLDISEDKLLGLDFVKILLLLGILIHPKNQKEKLLDFNDKIIKELERNTKLRINRANLKEPIVIISGGTDKLIENEFITAYKNVMIKAFEDFEGTIISGGTTSGISGIAVDIKQEYNEKIRLVGYIPRIIPTESNAITDDRFELYYSDGVDFSILEAFQYWFDIMRSGIDPSKVKLIGVNGGKISALEFRLAIVFGAQVGIIKGSRRAATDLINDPWWNRTISKEDNQRSKRLFKVIKNTTEDIRNFLTRPFITDPDIENLRMLIIQHKHGVAIYEKGFSTIPADIDLMSGLLSAVQTFSQEIGFGTVPCLTAKEGSITMTPFGNKDFRVFFFLWEKPSNSLSKKIEDFTQLCEENLADVFRNLYQVKTYKDDKTIGSLLSRVFGQEILRFYEEY